ncbi:MAG: hypothetical protein EA384_11325 [Spirochaetaceae bacterium]|nr:MAG: hypothetical protein EA384_11325 [Spirochaetaceae bacterium]
MKPLPVRCVPLIACLLLLWPAVDHGSALEIDDLCQAGDTELEIELRSRSGSPLLLELLISDPGGVVETVKVAGNGSSATFTAAGRKTIEIALTPFQLAGVYDLTISLSTAAGTCTRSLELGFTDFVWGRDNFRFSNARSRHGSARPYSATLFPWTDDRFGTLQPEERTVMLHVAYGLFGGAIGRCYAFSGSQLRYLRHPDLLPTYYDSIYAVREPHRAIQHEMNMLQNDMVFDHFVTRSYDINQPQSLEMLRAEIEAIVAAIGNGQPAVFGYLAPQRHHSMLAYGYLADPASDQITLIASNNWGTEISQNLHSRAAERVTVNLAPEYDNDQRIRWIDSAIREYRTAEHLFLVQVRDTYEHDRTILSQLLAQQRELLRHDERAVVIVEEGRDAFIQDDTGNVTGRHARRFQREIDGADYRHFDDVHVFEFPARKTVTLHVSELEPRDDGNPVFRPNVFVLTHRGGGDTTVVQHAVYKSIEIPDNEHFLLLVSPERLQRVQPVREEE